MNLEFELEVDIPKDKITSIQNFFRESKYLIMLSEDGQSKVLVLK